MGRMQVRKVVVGGILGVVLVGWVAASPVLVSALTVECTSGVVRHGDDQLLMVHIVRSFTQGLLYGDMEAVEVRVYDAGGRDYHFLTIPFIYTGSGETRIFPISACSACQVYHWVDVRSWMPRVTQPGVLPPGIVLVTLTVIESATNKTSVVLPVAQCMALPPGN